MLFLTPACWWRRPSVGEERGRALLEPRGSGTNGRGRLCFQCGPGFLRREEVLVAKSLAKMAARRNLEVVLLPIGWCHGDLDALRLVQEASGGRFTLVEDIESPLEVGAVIEACDYFVGSSLHGNVTALSFGVPHLVVNNPLRAAKLEGYVRLAGLEKFRITDWAALEETFDRLAELMPRAAEERRETGNRPAKSRAEIPLELYTTIAELHARLEDERAARRAVEKELSDSKKFLRDRHLAHKARLKRSEDRNASDSKPRCGR
jgi:hypothetical protein